MKDFELMKNQNKENYSLKKPNTKVVIVIKY